MHQNFISEADLPLESANQQGMAINRDGDLVFCCPVNLNKVEIQKSKESSRYYITLKLKIIYFIFVVNNVLL